MPGITLGAFTSTPSTTPGQVTIQETFYNPVDMLITYLGFQSATFDI